MYFHPESQKEMRLSYGESQRRARHLECNLRIDFFLACGYPHIDSSPHTSNSYLQSYYKFGRRIQCFSSLNNNLVSLAINSYHIDAAVGPNKCLGEQIKHRMRVIGTLKRDYSMIV